MHLSHSQLLTCDSKYDLDIDNFAKKSLIAFFDIDFNQITLQMNKTLDKNVI